MVLGDCGRYPVYLSAYKRCLKYWIKILKMPDNRLVKKCYKFLLNTDLNLVFNWTHKIRELLCESGFGYIWHHQTVINEKKFLLTFSERLKDQFLQSWWSTLENSSKLVCYKSIKHEFKYEHYLDILNVRKFRHCYAQLRSGSLELELERGRYLNIPREERLCKICNLGEVENELHFIFKCPMLSDIRNLYIPAKFHQNPSINKLYVLLCSDNDTLIKSLASYIYYALKRRNFLLEM